VLNVRRKAADLEKQFCATPLTRTGAERFRGKAVIKAYN